MRRLAITILLAAPAACGHPGLAPEPPGTDAADPDAKAAPASMPADVFSRSAFEGQTLKSGGHHHHHGKHGAKPAAKADAAQPEPEPKPEPAAEHAHEVTP